MEKHLVFTDKDEDLVKAIQKYQKSQNLPSFIEAVRRLCTGCLNMSNALKDIK